MDLIYVTSSGEENLAPAGDLDMAFGADENNFELIIPLSEHCLQYGDLIYLEEGAPDGSVMHTEYGGIVDEFEPDTDDDTMTYRGRTWHGIMEGKVLCPDSGADYLILSGDANTVLRTLISRMGLTDLFTADQGSSGITISSYQMERYVAGYTGIRKMLAAVGAKLKIVYDDGKVVLSAVPRVDYSQNEEWDPAQIDLQITKNVRPVNHIVCLGSGELKDRKVVHLYADAAGNVSRTRTFSGWDEVTAVYDYPNVESEDELIKGGTERLTDAYSAAEKISADLDSEENYDIGDIVGAVEIYTGTAVTREIVKKIIKLRLGKITIECKIGG